MNEAFLYLEQRTEVLVSLQLSVLGITFWVSWPLRLQFNYCRDPNTSLPAGPRIWPEMRYLNNYWMDCREIQCRHSCSPGHLAQSSTVASLTTAEVTLERLFHTLNCFLSLWLLWHRAVCFPFKTHTLPFFLSVSYFLTCLSRYLCSLSLSCHPILLSLPALWHTSSHLFSFSCSFSVSVAPAVCLSFMDTPPSGSHPLPLRCITEMKDGIGTLPTSIKRNQNEVLWITRVFKMLKYVAPCPLPSHETFTRGHRLYRNRKIEYGNATGGSCSKRGNIACVSKVHVVREKKSREGLQRGKMRDREGFELSDGEQWKSLNQSYFVWAYRAVTAGINGWIQTHLHAVSAKLLQCGVPKLKYCQVLSPKREAKCIWQKLLLLRPAKLK